MQHVGTLKEIWRYPVKGMAGEQLEQAEVGPQGVQGDRIWALWDVRRKEIQSCKARPALLQCVATTLGDGQHVEITFPGGSAMTSQGDRSEINQRLSDLVGHESRLEPLRPAADRDFFRRYQPGWRDDLVATFEREPGEPLPDFFDDFPDDAREFIAAPGSFFLVTTLHIVTTATLDHLRALNPSADWDLRRFRPNLVIETPAKFVGLVEQGWLGGHMTIGGVDLELPMTTPRCGATVRAQQGLPVDSSILRTIVRHADQNLGIYAEADTPGQACVGDQAELHLAATD